MDREFNITIRQLRTLLTHVGNQEITVRELRHRLFDEYNQEEILDNLSSERKLEQYK